MENSIIRCPWVDLTKPEYVDYHDREWGVPAHEDRLLFELLSLEAFQAGLSWYTVLRKRNHFRLVFDGFDPGKIAGYGEKKIDELLGNPGIIRNRAKVLGVVNNAKRFLEIQEQFGTFDRYIWGFVDFKPIVNELRKLEEYPARSRDSESLSQDLSHRGFKFVGPTVCYAHMQATGMVNDHAVYCFRRPEIIKEYETTMVPGHNGVSAKRRGRER
jgi:DNA-3-methyladenine glycosylase I